MKSKTAKKASTMTVDERLVAALGHRLRVQCLQIFSERPASPNELSEELGEGLSNVSHHVKVLRELGFIELLTTKQRRGAVEHFYQATARPFIGDEEWSKMSAKARREIPALIGGSIFGWYLRSLRAGTISQRDDSHLSWRHMHVDQEGWEELVRKLLEWFGTVEEIGASIRQRLEAAGETGMPVMIGLMGFETPYP